MASICVFCGSSTTVDDDLLELARRLGTELAGRGHTLVSGGGRVGMMGAVTMAARTAGGRTLGVIPAVLSGREIADVDSTELVVTDTMAERKTTMLDRADAFIALPGGLGTLDELFEVWTLASLGLHDKPIVLLDPDGFYAGLVSYLDGAQHRRLIRAEARALVRPAGSVPAALAAVEAALAAPADRTPGTGLSA